MKKICAFLLALSLLLPLTARAQAPVGPGESAPSPSPAFSAKDAIALLDEALTLERFEDKVALIREAAEKTPKDDPARANVLINCSRLLFYLDAESKYEKECEDMLREALSIAKGDQKILALQMLAEQLNYAGESDKAMALLRAYLKEDPRNDQLNIILASCQYYAGLPDDAIATLETLLEDVPDNITAASLRAEILVDSYQFEKGITAYQQIRDQFPDRLDGYYGLYITYEAAGDFERAARAIDALIQIGGDYDLWLHRAQLRLWQQYDPERALKEAEALLRADPDWMDVHVVKLGAQLHLEQYDEAMKTAEAIGEMDGAYGKLMRGIVAMSQKNWAQAEAYIEKSHEESPDQYLVWQNLATVRMEGYSDMDGALEAIAKGFDATEGIGTPTLFWELGRVYNQQGKLLDAARAFSAGDALTFEDSTPLYGLVITCMDAGRKQDMLDMLLEMEKCYPGWYDTMYARVVVEDILGNHAAAVGAFNALKEKFPFMAKSRVDLEGSLLAAAGDTNGPQVIKVWLDEKTDADSGNWALYAYSLMKLSLNQEAWAALKKAQALLPKDENAQSYDAVNDGIFIALIQAELMMMENDMNGSVAALETAAKLGWQPAALELQPVFAPLCATPAYQAFAKKYPSFEGDWNLTPMPEIPKVKE